MKTLLHNNRNNWKIMMKNRFLVNLNFYLKVDSLQAFIGAYALPN